MTDEFEDHCWKDVITPDVLEVYSCYRRKIFVGPRPALLAVDLYDVVYRGGARPPAELAKTHPNTCGEYAHAAIEPTNRPPVDPSDYAIRPEFKPQPHDVVITKQRASVFFGTPLVAHLTQLGIQTLIICGESTSGCVRATAVDAYSHGYHVVLVEECCFDRSILSHKINLFDMHHKYVDVMHVNDVVAHLDGMAIRKAS
jgi:maleamate amidohydrolase